MNSREYVNRRLNLVSPDWRYWFFVFDNHARRSDDLAWGADDQAAQLRMSRWYRLLAMRAAQLGTQC